MNITEVLEEGSVVLSEGLVVFRNSKRFMKLATKMERSLSFASNESERDEIIAYIQNVKQASSEFAEVENAYSSGDKEEAKASYNKLKIKYYNLVRDINTETMKKFILGAGLYIIFSVIVGGLGIFNSSQPNGSNENLNNIAKRIHDNTNKISSLKSENQKLELFNKNMKDIKELESKLSFLKSKTR